MVIPELFRWWVSMFRMFLNNAHSHISNSWSLCVHSNIFPWGHVLAHQKMFSPEHRAAQTHEKDAEALQGRAVLPDWNSYCCLKIICLMIWPQILDNRAEVCSECWKPLRLTPGCPAGFSIWKDSRGSPADILLLAVQLWLCLAARIKDDI